MDELFELFLDSMKKKGASDNTVLSYARDLKCFKEFLLSVGIETLDTVNQSNILAFSLFLGQQEKSTATIVRNLTSVRSLYKFLFNAGLVFRNPTVDVQMPRTVMRIPDVLTMTEVDSLLNVPVGDGFKPVRDRAMLELLYATGIRVSELIAVRIRDLNLKNGYIQCNGERNRRLIPFGKKTQEALMVYVAGFRTGNAGTDLVLFVNRNGAAMSRQGVWKVIKSYAKALNLDKKITPHTLRHSFAAHLIENGADVQAVQEMLGHSDLASTQMYVAMKKNKLTD